MNLIVLPNIYIYIYIYVCVCVCAKAPKKAFSLSLNVYSKITNYYEIKTNKNELLKLYFKN